ncbi:MAG: alpha/beta hydrolase [Candidatus Nanopelagicales bacterium]
MRLVWWGLSVVGLAVVAWALLTARPAVVHGHPAYAVMIGLTVVGCLLTIWRFRRARARRGAWRLAGSIVLAVLAVVWVASVWWVRPFKAVQPALDALRSDTQVQVSESATQIVMTPTGAAAEVGIFFQPGARVDARAYAAALRPLVEAGHPLVIAKQPLGIAFLAMGAFDSARLRLPDVQHWVLGGHSLGGTVAAMQADRNDEGDQAPAVGLMFWASFPASDLSESLTTAVTSIYGTEDGLATAADIADSKAHLPAATSFVPIQGAVHAFFGDYGPQPGDGTPTITHDQARQEISAASLKFVDGVLAPR